MAIEKTSISFLKSLGGAATLPSPCSTNPKALSRLSYERIIRFHSLSYLNQSPVFRLAGFLVLLKLAASSSRLNLSHAAPLCCCYLMEVTSAIRKHSDYLMGEVAMQD